MRLTSLWLLAVTGTATAAAIAILALLWGRLRGPLIGVRVVGILVSEALLLALVGLTVNRAGDFYPSWASLLGEATPVELPTTGAVHLSPQLAAQAATGQRDGLVFRWNPAGQAGWRLAEPPTVYLPPASFRGSNLNVPVIVVVLSPTAKIPTDAELTALARVDGVPACLVLLHESRSTHLRMLAEGLAAQLPANLPVLGHGWAAVGAGSAAPAALALWQADSATFAALALLPGPGAPIDAATVRQARAATWSRLWIGHPHDDLAAALRWSGQHVPPPLSPPSTLTALPAPSVRPGQAAASP